MKIRIDRTYALLTLLLLVSFAMGGCSRDSQPKAVASQSAGASEGSDGFSIFSRSPRQLVVVAGTDLRVRLDQAVSSQSNRPGDEFDATVTEPVIVEGKTVVPKDTRVKGLIVDARESGHLETPARLVLSLRSMEVAGESYQIETDSFGRSGKSHKNRDLFLIGGGAGLGSVIGAIAGGGKGALIGGLAGAGAGTAGAAATGKKEIILPAETLLTFKLKQPVTVQVKG